MSTPLRPIRQLVGSMAARLAPPRVESALHRICGGVTRPSRVRRSPDRDPAARAARARADADAYLQERREILRRELQRRE